MKKATLRFYSKNNLGDDLFVKIISERYKNKFLTHCSTRPEPEFLLRQSNIENHNNRLFSFLFRIASKLFHTSNAYLLYLVRKSTMVIYAGGSIFIEGPRLGVWENEINFYNKLSVPYYIIGSNFGPYKSPEFAGLVRNILAGAEDVCFRDNASYDIFSDINSTRVATDIAFSLDTSAYDIKSEKTAVLSIIDCSRKFDQDTTEAYEAEIIRMTYELIERGLKIVYMSFCKHEGDEVAIRRILQKVSPVISAKISTHFYNGNIESALALLASCKIVVASRFHAVILGLIFGKKVLPFAYSDKTTNILNDMNFRGPLIDIRKMDEFNGAAFDFSELRQNDISSQVVLANEQFRELDKVLTRKSTNE